MQRFRWDDSEDFYADVILLDAQSKMRLPLRLTHVDFMGGREDWKGEEVPRPWAGLPPLSELWESWEDAPLDPEP